MIRLALVLIALALPARATQDAWPALHDVVGVAADDVLNIREEPSATSAIVGTLAHDATEIEVIRATDDLRWGLVNTGERSGWVSMAYLERGPGQWWGAASPLASCSGTEPFWTLEIGADWVLSTPEGEAFRAPAQELSGSVMSRWRHGGVSLTADGRPVVLVTGAETCTDGMSDREYGIGATLMVGAGAEMTYYAGCCTLAR